MAPFLNSAGHGAVHYLAAMPRSIPVIAVSWSERVVLRLGQWTWTSTADTRQQNAANRPRRGTDSPDHLSIRQLPRSSVQRLSNVDMVS